MAASSKGRKVVPGAAIFETFAAAGLDVRPYSGRGMYGKSCYGVVADRGVTPASLLTDILGRCSVRFRETLRNYRTDAMGMSFIMYWPQIPYEFFVKVEVPAGPTARESRELAMEYKERAADHRNAGGSVSINYELPSVAVTRSDGSAYYYQEWQADERLDEARKTMSDTGIGNYLSLEEYFLATSTEW